MMVMEASPFGDNPVFAVLLLLIALAVMALVWGLLIYLVSRLLRGSLGRYITTPRQKVVVGCSFGFLCMTILSWVIVSMRSVTPIRFTALPEVKSTVDGNTAFALDLYQKLKQQPGNLFFSPYSISTALAMTYAGARGQTESEIAKTLHFDDLPQEKIHAAFKALTTRTGRIQRWNRITLITANSLWCQLHYPLTDTFSNVIRTDYKAELRLVNFKAPADTAREINAWVERKTAGRIQNLADPRYFTPFTRLVLCDVIYFKGKWQTQFKPKDTRPAVFYVSTNETVTVPMMWQESQFKTAYDQDKTVELLELPYVGKDLSMIILLPTQYSSPDAERNDLSALEQKLTVQNLHGWFQTLDQTAPHKTIVLLPRFNMTQSFDLADQLKSLGMPSAFNDTADFSGMDGTTNLFISDVIHKAFIEVNEAGTEAAAATWVYVKTKSMALSFIVDHPFVFLIRDNGSGAILFVGRVVDPTKQ